MAAERSFDGWASARWLIVVVLIVIGSSATFAVGPAGTDVPPTDFSAMRAMEHIRSIARSPHPMGSSEIERVREYIVGELRDLGLEMSLQRVPAPDVFGSAVTVDVVNVIAWIPGTANGKAVVLTSHYDTVPTTPGANDDSAAVAGLLETARALRAGPPLANDVVLLFTDGEEPAGRFGATAFVATPGIVGRLGVVVNFEANGASGASLLVETSGPEAWLIDQYGSAVPQPAAFSFLTETARLLGDIGTDFDIFRNAGVPGLHFAYLRGSPIYHTPADNIASVSAGSVQHHGSQALAIARHFGNLDLTAIPESGGAVFFSISSFLVRYPESWSLPLAVTAFAGFTVAYRRRRLPDGMTFGSVARSIGGWLLAIVIAALAGTAAWIALVAVRTTPDVVESYGYGALVWAAAVVVGRHVAGRLHRGDAVGSRHGCVGLWTLLAVVTAATLPGFSYLFGWPALAGVGGLLWRPCRRASAILRFSLIAAATLVLMAPAVDVFFSLAQPRPGNPDSEVTAVMIVPLVLVVLVASLLTSGWQHPDREGDAAR